MCVSLLYLCFLVTPFVRALWGLLLSADSVARSYGDTTGFPTGGLKNDSGGHEGSKGKAGERYLAGAPREEQSLNPLQSLCRVTWIMQVAVVPGAKD